MNLKIVILTLIISSSYIYSSPIDADQDPDLFGLGSFSNYINNFNSLLESLENQDVDEDNLTKAEESIAKLKKILSIIKNAAVQKVQDEDYFREFLADNGFYPKDKVDLDGQGALDAFNEVIKDKLNSVALIEKQIFAILKEKIDDYDSDLDDINSALAIGDTQTARQELEKAIEALDFIRYKSDEDIGDDQELMEFLSNNNFYLPSKLKLSGPNAQQEFDAEIKLKLDALNKIDANISKMEQDATDKLNRLTNPTNISINNPGSSNDIHSQIDAWLKTSGELVAGLFGLVTVVQVARGKWSPLKLAQILTSDNKAKAFLDELAKTNPLAADALKKGLDKGKLTPAQADLILKKAGIDITEDDIPKVKLIVQASDNPVELAKALKNAGIKFENSDLVKLKTAFQKELASSQKELAAKALSAQDRLKLARENLAKEMEAAQAEATAKAKAIGASVNEQVKELQAQMSDLQEKLIADPNNSQLQEQRDELQAQIDEAVEPEAVVGL